MVSQINPKGVKFFWNAKSVLLLHYTVWPLLPWVHTLYFTLELRIQFIWNYPVSVGNKSCPCWICYECVQLQLRVISRCGSRSPLHAEVGHFTLLFYRVRQITAPRFLTHMQSQWPFVWYRSRCHCCRVLLRSLQVRRKAESANRSFSRDVITFQNLKLKIQQNFFPRGGIFISVYNFTAQ